MYQQCHSYSIVVVFHGVSLLSLYQNHYSYSLIRIGTYHCYLCCYDSFAKFCCRSSSWVLRYDTSDQTIRMMMTVMRRTRIILSRRCSSCHVSPVVELFLLFSFLYLFHVVVLRDIDSDISVVDRSYPLSCCYHLLDMMIGRRKRRMKTNEPIDLTIMEHVSLVVGLIFQSY
jgi:hypothetical protein